MDLSTYIIIESFYSREYTLNNIGELGIRNNNKFLDNINIMLKKIVTIDDLARLTVKEFENHREWSFETFVIKKDFELLENQMGSMENKMEFLENQVKLSENNILTGLDKIMKELSNIREELIMSSEAYRRLDRKLEAVVKIIEEKLGVKINSI